MSSGRASLCWIVPGLAVVLLLAGCAGGQDSSRYNAFLSQLETTTAEAGRVIAKGKILATPNGFQEYGRDLGRIADRELAWLNAFPPSNCYSETHREFVAWMTGYQDAARLILKLDEKPTLQTLDEISRLTVSDRAHRDSIDTTRAESDAACR